jgi:catechol 2,3-dioxygenase-like lactoylglutathione lyase family enzyme
MRFLPGRGPDRRSASLWQAARTVCIVSAGQALRCRSVVPFPAHHSRHEGPLERKEKTVLQTNPLYAYIPAKDVARARQFYEHKLGFTPKETNGGVIYEFGGGTACFLYPTPNAGTSKASQAFWRVDDAEREVAELKARGVVFEDYDMPGEKSANGVVTAGGAKAAWFKDSEGNILAIIQSM